MNDFLLALDVSNPLHWLPVLLVLSIVQNLRSHSEPLQ
jgi:hypothetical protein